MVVLYRLAALDVPRRRAGRAVLLTAIFPFAGVTALLFAAAIPFVWRKFGPAYGLFMLMNLYVPLSSGAFEGLDRYCSVLFPAFIWLASIRHRYAYTTLVVVFALFYTLGLALFTTVHPLL